jgi:hypothetical protein
MTDARNMDIKQNNWLVYFEDRGYGIEIIGDCVSIKIYSRFERILPNQRAPTYTSR